MSEMTRILEPACAGDPREARQLLPLVYDDLRRFAAGRLARQPPGHTLQATALVHEAYLRLIAGGERAWQDRRHFFASAATAMRHILVDRARRRTAERHGGGLTRVELDGTLAMECAASDVVRLHAALEKLEAHDAPAAEIVALRFFGGLTQAQAAELLGVSERTAKRLWAYARAWLYDELQAGA